MARHLTPAELRVQLRDQLDLLITYCGLFDEGQEVMAKPMATSLRVLLHSSPNPKGNSRALLDQLHLRTGRWYDIAGPINPGNLLSSCGLIVYEVGNSTARCRPQLGWWDGREKRRTPFPVWWSGPVARNVKTGETFSRMEILGHVRDSDGGAHVDRAIDNAYSSLRGGEFLGWEVAIGPPDADGTPVAGAHLAAVRTIAHEALLSLQQFAPQAFPRPYAPPT